MPIYEYVCDSCGNDLEVIQKISDEPLTECPSCKENGLKKKTSMSAFHLKGGGWYKDGYGNNNTSSSSDTKNSANSTKTGDSKDKQKTEKKENKEKTETKKSNPVPSTKAS